MRLLIKSGDIIAAIKRCCSNLQISGCWQHEKIKTIHISASYEGRQLNAWGADKNESIALAKSLMELVERIHLKHVPTSWINLASGEMKTHSSIKTEWPILNTFLQTSSGMAVHFDEHESQKNALLELIERHVITKSMLQGLNAKAISDNTFVWQGPLHSSVVIVRHDTGNSKFVYGTAAGYQLETAVKSANREIAPLISWSKNSANIKHLLQSATSNRPSEIQAYHLSTDHQISVLNAANQVLQTVSPEINKEHIWITEIANLEAFDNLGLKITRAFSPLMQPLYFGKLSTGPINPLAVELNKLNFQADYNVVA